MAKVTDMIQSKFLRKEDFPEDMICTIKSVGVEEVGQNETRWVIHFNEYQKGMVLNVTSIRVLEQAFGDDSDRWLGNKVKIYVDPNVSFNGKVVGGLRLMPPRRTAKPPEKKPEPDFDDGVPF